ncbi:kinetochore Sim4 complex subunit Fta4 [Achaetomium macrosporum]|uniref:Kinetochore Sim4 complex subunit Fta4 n=1 Tax=Achaetomium macrosporum TaxID=79813 RepID=A0AAN7HI05_9PEZI|nr:kinetochore Sim4 complex subunit Fta4 [Achaetomium macrosporum]
MAPTPPTIVSLKQSFLTSQTRLLSQPLAPTRAWRKSNNETSQGSDEQQQQGIALSEKAVDDALFKLNHRLQQHARRVYAPQATRHVAEQIDQLYWNAAEARTGRGGHGHGHGGDDDDGEGGDGEEGVGEAVEGLSLGADLADPSVIATIPLEWDHPAEAATQPVEAKRYAELAAELHALAERKREAAARVARLRRIQALLEPFSPSSSSSATLAGEDGGDGGGLKGVQENLVTRNGEIEAELSRMRVLLARVGGRVSQLKEQAGSRGAGDSDSSVGSLFSERGGGVEDVEMNEQRKVGMLLERF